MGELVVVGSTHGDPSALPSSLFGYDVVSKLGLGAASTIYVVTDSSNQLFALKHVIRETEKHDRFIDQLTNEYDIGGRFTHPFLRRILDLKLKRSILGGKPNEAALVMELIDGTALDDKPPASLAAVYSLFKRIGQAIAAMHYQRVVHCDVKPRNILRLADENIKMIDFGQACAFGTVKPRVQGTPDYIAPEQVKCRPVDGRTDLYNYGATLYWSLTGRRVPTYITVQKSERHIVKKQEFPTPRDLNAGVPVPLSELVMKCLRYYPNDRPESIGAVMTIIEQCEAETLSKV